MFYFFSNKLKISLEGLNEIQIKNIIILYESFKMIHSKRRSSFLMLSEKNRFVRKNILKLNVNDFADLLGVNRRTISAWENEGMNPSLNNIINISILSNISIDSFIKGNKGFELVCRDISREQYDFLNEVIKEYRKTNNAKNI